MTQASPSAVPQASGSRRALALGKRLVLIFAAALLAAPAWSHEGEDHGAPAGAALAGEVAPRTFAQSEDFEVVAVLTAGKLTLYLDRYADNAPVPGAQVEIDNGAWQGAATELAPGVYVIPGAAFAHPGRYPLTISVQAGNTSDLLSATLDLGAPAAGVEHAHGWGEWAVWGAAGGVLALAGGLIVVRRRKHRH